MRPSGLDSRLCESDMSVAIILYGFYLRYFRRSNKTLAEIAAIVNKVGAIKGGVQQGESIFRSGLQIRILGITATGSAPHGAGHR